MSTNSVNLDVTQYVRVNNSKSSITLQSSRDVVRVALSNIKPSRDNTVFHTLSGADNPLQFLNIDSDVWVLATSENTYLVVTETDIIGKNDWYSEVSKGNVPGHTIETIQGENLDVDTSSPENLWGAGGMMVYPVAGETWEIVSSDSGDTFVGDGARLIAVQYLDVNHVEQVEVVQLNGITPVTMNASDCFRPISATTIQAGVQGFNIGEITVSNTANGDPRLDIPPLYNQSTHGFFTVPAGKTAYIIYGHSSLGKNKDGKIDIYIANDGNGIFIKSAFADLFQNSVVFLPKAPVGGFSEKTDIQFLCTTLNANTDASAFIQLLIIDNE